MAHEACRRHVAGSPYKLKDRKQGPSEFVISICEGHEQHFAAYDVDGCLIKDGLRCDYLVLPNPESVVLIELKGGDVEKGFSQLKTTLVSLKGFIGSRRKYAVLVPIRYPLPPYQTAKYQDLFRRLGCKLRVRNRKFLCRTSEF
jgi:hypothetical protein